MRIDRIEFEKQARRERAQAIGNLIGSAIAAAAQFVSNAWRSSSSRGTNSKVPS
jgi:hypothetical protein